LPFSSHISLLIRAKKKSKNILKNPLLKPKNKHLNTIKFVLKVLHAYFSKLINILEYAWHIISCHIFQVRFDLIQAAEKPNHSFFLHQFVERVCFFDLPRKYFHKCSSNLILWEFLRLYFLERSFADLFDL